MKPRVALRTDGLRCPARRRGTVLIIVLWIAFGLVAMALYFAHTMAFELQSSDNRVASIQAEEAVAGACRSVSNLLAVTATYQQYGWPPYVNPDQLNNTVLFETAAVPVGRDARFWLLGRDPFLGSTTAGLADQPTFGLVDESSKLNINTATVDMLMMLPRMTPDLAANIIAWRESTNSGSYGATVSTLTGATLYGVGNETYNVLTPSYTLKGGRFESVEELRLVYGATLDILYGEDANLNGILDPNENDGDQSAPTDNQNGRLDPGLFEYLTPYTRDSLLASDGVTLKAPLDGSDGYTNLSSILSTRLGSDRAQAIVTAMGGSTGTGGGGGGGGGGTTTSYTNLMQFYVLMRYNTSVNLTAEEFALIEGDLVASTNAVTEGLVNVNTASEAVLNCIPGIGYDEQTGGLLSMGSQLVAERQNHLASVPSMGWVVDVLGAQYALQASPWLTSRSYQYRADIVAVGHNARGYRRSVYLFDISEGWPRIIFRRDLTHLGWALGQSVRRDLQLEKENR